MGNFPGVITGYKRSKSNTYPTCTLLKIDGVRTREDTQFYCGVESNFFPALRAGLDWSYHRRVRFEMACTSHQSLILYFYSVAIAMCSRMHRAPMKERRSSHNSVRVHAPGSKIIGGKVFEAVEGTAGIAVDFKSQHCEFLI